jgi:hypothetical protein
MSRANRKQRQERESRIIETCYEVVEKLAELKVTERGPDTHLLSDESLSAVLTIMDEVPGDIVRDVFWMMDEKPGTFGYDWDGQEWHFKLRQLRNNQDFGKRMFAMFDSKERQ